MAGPPTLPPASPSASPKERLNLLILVGGGLALAGYLVLAYANAMLGSASIPSLSALDQLRWIYFVATAGDVLIGIGLFTGFLGIAIAIRR